MRIAHRLAHLFSLFPLKARGLTGGIGAGVILVLLAACAALSPVESPEPPPKFARIEGVSPRWQPFARESAPGLDYFAGNIRKPRLEFRVLRVDLGEKALRIVTSGDPAVEESPAGPGTVPSTWVSGFVRRYNCLAGINTAPFSPVSGKEGEVRTISGLVVSRGLLISPPHPSFDALVFYRSGGAAIVKQAEIGGGLGEIENAAGGFYAILRGGELPERLSVLEGTPPRHPRSAGGLSAEGNFLYLLVIDGRRPGSVGATEAETGLLLKQLGASWGINFDGGGSTALALRYPDGKIRPVNTPIHHGIPGRERGVAACLGIALAPAEGGVEEPAGGDTVDLPAASLLEFCR